MTERYGAWVEKSMYGRKYMGIERSTFLIGKDGKVARVWRKVSVPGHAADGAESRPGARLRRPAMIVVMGIFAADLTFLTPETAGLDRDA